MRFHCAIGPNNIKEERNKRIVRRKGKERAREKGKKGGNGEYRTHDLKIMRLTLYRLSYVPVQRKRG